MDPNETLRLMAIALLEENADEARKHYEDIRAWMERKRSEPAWAYMSRQQFQCFDPSTGQLSK
jgi:hypothetical protein